MTEQFRTLEDLRDKIKEYEGYLARPTKNLSHPTLYRKTDVAEGDVVLKGIRVGDWYMSDDLKWVLPHDQMGLSFSSTWQNLKGVHKMKQKHSPDNARIHVYWVLEGADIPKDMKFEKDREKKGHYFLTVTEPITLQQLIDKLKFVARCMSVIRDARKAL